MLVGPFACTSAVKYDGFRRRTEEFWIRRVTVETSRS